MDLKLHYQEKIFEHHISSKQTLYSLSKFYGLSLSEVYYYNPEFQGSYSIKTVLPVLVPDMTYEGMEVGNGSDAIAVFAYLAQGKYEGSEAEEKRRQLLEYCKMDTLGMVRLVGEMVVLAKKT